MHPYEHVSTAFLHQLGWLEAVYVARASGFALSPSAAPIPVQQLSKVTIAVIVPAAEPNYYVMVVGEESSSASRSLQILKRVRLSY